MSNLADADDNSSDTHDVQYVDQPAGIVEVSDVQVSPKKTQSPATTTATTTEPMTDTASVHSAPAVRVSNNDQSSNTPPSSALPPPSPSRSTHRDSPDDRNRLSRRRSTVEPRSSKRLSGFFNNLIHRRDGPARGNTRDEQPAASSSSQREKSDSNDPSRSSSPTPPTLAPPPRLPPPTLQELGLSLSVVTPNLSPSHFSTPPSSGAFLSPHYLLLCHAQGLDVLPLVSPPEPQPYALIRRVSFKSIVVMEHRGVLVAIAGRRDGVRVYALEEIRKAVEWRMEVEIRREKERMRRELAKKIASGTVSDVRDSSDKARKPSSSTPPPSDFNVRAGIPRKGSHGHIPPPSEIPTLLVPRTPTARQSRASSNTSQVSEPSGRPPPYSASEHTSPQQHVLRPRNSTISLTPTRSRSRGGSISDVLNAPPISRVNTEVARPRDPDSKEDWVESSDDEAINVVAAGSSGSQALDERTSVRHAHSPSQSTNSAHAVSPPHPHTSSASISRRNRPANLDLSLSLTNTAVAPSEPSPAPTLLTLRQALSHSPPRLRDLANGDHTPDPDTPLGDGDDDDDDGGVDGQISLTQALLESRLPHLPPLGTRRPQQPILIAASHPVATGDDEPSSPRTSDAQSAASYTSDGSHATSTANGNNRRRRRWSVMLGQSSSISPPSGSIPSNHSASAIAPMRERTPTLLARSNSRRSDQSAPPRRPSSAGAEPNLPSPGLIPPLPENAAMVSSASAFSSLNSAASITSATSSSTSRSRFLPKIISNAINNIRSDNDRPSSAGALDADGARKVNGTPVVAHAPPPKLEYVKLPGTKGSLMVKAVETNKKSFLAILCGENGEKVELFAGTYRTALGLSRTFILPDSPRSLELQLQGDDLVEVFLVFSQNVFGLEPATVRVREVRIGRAERRAARRRAREARNGENAAPTNDSEAQFPGEEDNTNVNVSIGVSVSVGATVVASGSGPAGPQTPPFVANQHPEQDRSTPSTIAPATVETVPENNSEAAVSSSAVAQAEELVALATARMGPYTTFQQLSFAPQFPLASIADEYVIPPTYPDFIEYRAEHEPSEGSGSAGGSVDLAQVNFSPPGLPVPTPSAPSKWFYRDPKGVVHGPWKASLMQAWYKDGLLPPDLPVRKEEDSEYMLLKDLRLQSVDPTHPFRAPRTPSSNASPANVFQPSDKPLLKPISLLAQPRHFGPPALFFSSRGGHSTAIVDARGRSVLKGRFVWSEDDRQGDDSKPMSLTSRMGDVKRLEALDINDRSVLIAMRQGGVEAVDLSDALLRPADESRTMLPQFNPAVSSINRRAPFVWRIGTPVSSSPTSATILSARPKTGHSHMANLAKNKLSSGSAKSPAGRAEFNIGDADGEFHDEVLFLGRKEDEIYICERNAGSFRILRISPNTS